MSEILNNQNLRTVQSLYTISPEFRNQFDRLVKTKIAKAKDFLNKLSFDGAEKQEAPEAPTKKRGRPAGSKNKAPAKPKKEKKPEGQEPASARENGDVTHKAAILTALTASSDGLSAGQILEAITAAKHKRYTPPTKATLYTTLNGMKNDGVVSMIGERPNTKYVVA